MVLNKRLLEEENMGYFASFPDSEGCWSVDVNGTPVEIYVETLFGEQLMVCVDDLEEIFELVSDLLKISDEDENYVLANSLGNADCEEIWRFVP